MKINILYGVEGAKSARGITIIVDVYRAASAASYALGQGANYIIPVATKEEALQRKKENSSYLLMGEEHGIFIEGFDFGNSPYEIVKKDLSNAVLVHRTSQGTQGLVNATFANELIFGSFPTASAIALYIKKRQPQVVSIVAMDGKDSEDDVFANYLRDLLLGKHPDKENVKQYLRNHEVSARFLDPKLTEFPKEDIDYCLAIDHFNFVCLVKRQNSDLQIIKHNLD
jgi:2-phosphosulfolactate phosphatase